MSNNDLQISYSSIYGFPASVLVFTGKNNWLGTANGQVKVTCTDAKGNTLTRLLSEQVGTTPPNVKIFFDMYKTYTGTDPSHLNSKSLDKNLRFTGFLFSLKPQNASTYFPPLWYLFWKEGNVIPKLNDLNRYGESLFVWGADDPSPTATQSYGDTRIEILSNGVPFERITLYRLSTTTNYGIPFTDLNSKTFLKGGKGIHLQCYFCPANEISLPTFSSIVPRKRNCRTHRSNRR